jgi:Holliday junction resolvasome RuvABC endonuclease subunit
MILGLDVSTSITGYTLIDGDKIVLNGVWDTRKYKDFFEKVKHVKAGLEEIYEQYGEQIGAVYIEQSLQTFRSGFSSAKTLSTLSRFNGIVSWLVFDQYKTTPEYLAATSARKLCGIKVPRGQKAKAVVLKFLLDNEPSFVIDYTRNGNPKPESYDKADSMVIAKAGVICEARSLK